MEGSCLDFEAVARLLLWIWKPQWWKLLIQKLLKELDLLEFVNQQPKQEIDLVHQSSIKAFSRSLANVRRPEVDILHRSEIPSGQDTSLQATYLQLRQFIGEYLAAL